MEQAIVILLVMCLLGILGLGSWRVLAPHLAATPAPLSEADLRGMLARRLTTWAIVFIAILGAFILVCAGTVALNAPTDKDARKEFFNVAQYVLGTLLPVVAGWVGTVLAFYFGKANFEAGAKNAESLVRQLTPRERLQSKAVKDVMRPLNQMAVLQIPVGENPGHVTLRKLIAEGFEKNPQQPENRLPILDAASKPKYLLHRSVVDAFLAATKNPGATPPVTEDTLTLADLAAAPRLQATVAKGFVLIAEQASLAEAKDALEKEPRCLDVLVTQDGTIDSPVVGWLTNNRILEEASV